MIRRRHWVVATLLLAGAAALSCASEESIDFGTSPPTETPVFVPPDADASPDAAVDELTNYCPTDKCTSGRTTCPSSRFACDVDLKTDPLNCGACGVVCPAKANGAIFACSDGKCVMTCDYQGTPIYDCNGVPDDGCEVTATTNENCGWCGNSCEDPANPCIASVARGGYGCGCADSEILCTVNGKPKCLDPSKDDKNCAVCDNVCDPTNGGAPAYTNGYYGCKDSECGKLKCNSNFGDCNGKREDGCEAPLMSNENCGACGNACPDGQGCYLSIPSFTPACMCPAGKTLCTVANILGTCVDITSDPANCGGCQAVCPGDNANRFIYAVCRYGSCETDCKQGHANCNGDIEDGCEINTDSDPQNCGECGHQCDAVAGQACVLGRCAVEPCNVDADAGEATR